MLLQDLFLSSGSTEPEPRPVRILYYVQHNLTVPPQQEKSTTRYSGTFAMCEWLQEHPKCYVMGKPVTLWCINLLQPGMNIIVLYQFSVPCHRSLLLLNVLMVKMSSLFPSSCKFCINYISVL